MKRQKINSKKIIQIVTTLILCIILILACLFGYSVYKDTATFDSKKLLSSGASVMYDSNGDIMYTYGSQENGTRKNVTYDDLPQVLVDAIVAAEDSRFFEHNGFDLPRIVKAALSNLTLHYLCMLSRNTIRRVVCLSGMTNHTRIQSQLGRAS